MFNDEELLKVKEKALNEHIPIIMDDTLNVIKDILEILIITLSLLNGFHNFVLEL